VPTKFRVYPKNWKPELVPLKKVGRGLFGGFFLNQLRHPDYFSGRYLEVLCEEDESGR